MANGCTSYRQSGSIVRDSRCGQMAAPRVVMGVHPGEREHAEDDFQQHVHGDAGELPAEDDGRAGEGDNLRLQQQQGAAGIGDGAQQRKN